MDIQQAINLCVLRRFAREGIELACPATTIHLTGAAPVPRGELSVITEEARYGTAT